MRKVPQLAIAGIAAVALVGLSLVSSVAANANTGPLVVFAAGPTNYIYFNQVNSNSSGTSAVTFTSVYNGATPNQWAVAKAQLRDEWGFICWGPQNFSSASDGVASTSCHVSASRTAVNSNGIVWGWNGSTWVQRSTYTLWFGPGARIANPLSGEQPEWPRNATGQTYGNSALAEPSHSPDLVTATATNGARGYLLKSDIDNVTAADLLSGNTDPAAIQDWIDTVGSTDRTIPVYASNGTTVVGEFLVPAVNHMQETPAR